MIHISVQFFKDNDPEKADTHRMSVLHHVLGNFGIPSENVWIRGELPSGYRGVCRNLEYSQVHDNDKLPNIPVVLVQPNQSGVVIKGETSLVDFVHPEDCLYFFGDDLDDLTLRHLEYYGVDPDFKVYIPQSWEWSMYAASAVSIVLYDRFVKRGDFG